MIPVCVSSWSLHSEFLNPTLSGIRALDFPRIAREFGVASIEFYEGDYAHDFMSKEVTEAHAHAIREQCVLHGINIACISAVNDLGRLRDSPAELGTERERLKKWARHCEILNCPLLRINLGLPFDVSAIERLKEELKRLCESELTSSLVFVLENHPIVLDARKLDLLLELVQELNSPRIRTCPDLGALEAGLWHDAICKLARSAGHVHLKPWVLDRDNKRIELAEYAPVVREVLERAKYEGVVSIEYTGFRDLESNPLEDTRALAKTAVAAFGVRSHARRPPESVPPVALATTAQEVVTRKKEVNQDVEIVPDSDLLALLADGCELNLDAEVYIHDFASKKWVCSAGANHHSGGHREDAPRILRANYCERVCGQPRATNACARFYDQKLAMVSNQHPRHLAGRIDICPMGLSVLSVPVADDENLYGIVACGAWFEPGTEGLITDGIIQHTDTSGRRDLEEATKLIKPISVEDQRRSLASLVKLAKHLTGLYQQRFLAKHDLRLAADIVGKLRQHAATPTSNPDAERFAKDLKNTVSEFSSVIRNGILGLYKCDFDRSMFELLTSAGGAESDSILPSTIPFSVNAEDEPTKETPDLRDRLRKHLQAATTGLDCRTPNISNSNILAVFCFHPRRISGIEETLIDHFAAEIEYTVKQVESLATLNEFIDRMKHALSRPLSSIADRVRKMGRLLRGDKAHVSFNEFEQLQNKLQIHASEATNILRRFTSRVRLEGQDSLRPPSEFQEANLAHILKSCVDKSVLTARERNIRIRFTWPSSILPVVRCDASAMSELFDNLLENAVKYADAESFIPILVQRSSEVAEPYPRWELKQPGLRFVVQNQGPGIPESDRERIFEKYTQGTAQPIGRVIPGTGLGLAICRQVVAQHGGIVRVTSEPSGLGRGEQGHIVRFIVDIPT